MRFEYPADTSFTCSRCGLCCGDTAKKIRHVLLVKSEAEKISQMINQPIHEFADVVKGKAPYAYEMHKRQDDGKCIFLVDNNCSVYSIRPLICRFYPFELSTSVEGKYVFSVTSECPGVLCPDTEGIGTKLGVNYFKALFRLAKSLLIEKEF